MHINFNEVAKKSVPNVMIDSPQSDALEKIIQSQTNLFKNDQESVEFIKQVLSAR